MKTLVECCRDIIFLGGLQEEEEVGRVVLEKQIELEGVKGFEFLRVVFRGVRVEELQQIFVLVLGLINELLDNRLGLGIISSKV